MRVLLDNCVMRRFANLISDHEVLHAKTIGWAELQNGNLIDAAEHAGFDAIITVDKNLQYQQNLKDRKISIIVLSPLFIFYDHLVPLVPKIEIALKNLPNGAFIVIKP